MKEKELITYVRLGVSVVVVGVVAKTYLDIAKQEKLKRQDISAEMHLDIKAINQASAAMHDRMRSGNAHIRNLNDLREQFDTEIKFQKIAVREE